MVTILTGEIDSGKTTKLISLYRERGRGDGIALPKIYLGGVNAGQRIVRLKTGESEIFSLKSGFIPEGWEIADRLGDYAFSVAGRKFADQIFKEIIRNNCRSVYLDEIGPLELGRKGFYRILKALLARDIDLILCVRRGCLNEVIRFFGIRDAQIECVGREMIKPTT